MAGRPAAAGVRTFDDLAREGAAAAYIRLDGADEGLALRKSAAPAR